MLYALLHYLVDNGVIVHRKRNDDHCVEHVVIYQLIHGSAADIRRGVHVHILEALEHQHFVTSGLFKMFRDGVDYRLGRLFVCRRTAQTYNSRSIQHLSASFLSAGH